MTQWLEIIVPCAVISADEVAAHLAGEVAEAAAGVEIRGTDVVFWAPVERAEAALATTAAVAARLAAAGLQVDPQRVRSAPAVPEEEWRDAWKRYFHPTRLTRQLVVVPSWEQYEPDAEQIVLHLDPGQAFGTGLHASTRLVLDELQELADGGQRVGRILDLGTGSGILAIAAARFWPGARITAIDNDPLAVSATAENAERNQVQAQVSCDGADLSAHPGPFDLILANIQANVLIDLCEPLLDRLAPGGTLLLSGILTVQIEEVRDRYTAAGARCEEVRAAASDGAWSSLRLRARS
jgi:ribosomal protein L11 methyltransferase